MDTPPVVALRQTHPQPAVADVPGEVRRLWRASRLPQRLRPGASVAVAVGSRGVANLAAIVRATLDAIRELGARPFVVAAPKVPLRSANASASEPAGSSATSP